MEAVHACILHRHSHRPSLDRAISIGLCHEPITQYLTQGAVSQVSSRNPHIRVENQNVYLKLYSIFKLV